MTPPDDPWMTLAQAAAEAQLHAATVRRAIAAGALQAIRVSRTGSRGGRLIRLRRSWLDAWLQGSTGAPGLRRIG